MRSHLTIAVFLFTLLSFGQTKYPLEGRWDIEMEMNSKTIPSWLEMRHSGFETLVGRFVFAFGSARPVAEIKMNGNKFSFTLPRQWEPEGNDLVFHGELIDDTLKGSMVYTDGKVIYWTAQRAKGIAYDTTPKFGKPIALFNGKNLDDWHVDRDTNQWVVKDEILTNPESGANLISNQKFKNFKLNTTFRYPKGSNSGIYLRGRYEVQIADNKGLAPSDIYFGGIYGFLEPNSNKAAEPGTWQTFEITLIGQRVTVIANGTTIISDQTIPGITGGAIDSKEGEAGPFMIQGDHGPIEFKEFVVTPIE